MSRQMIVGTVVGAVAVTAIGGIAGFRMLDHDERYAEVVAVEPVTKTITVPREECGEEVVTRQKPVKDEHQVAGTVAGAVIGGVLGSKVGDGKGKDLATVGGAVAGGYAGNKIQEKVQEGNTEQEVEVICRTVYDKREEQDGYQVTYRFEGEEHVVHMDHDPGRRIELEDGKPVVDS